MIGKEIAGSIRVEWSESREELAWAGLGPRRRRRAVSRVALGCALAVVASYVAWPRATATAPVISPVAEPASTLELRATSTEHETNDSEREQVADVAAPARTSKSKVYSYDPVIASSGWRELARDGEYERAYVVYDRSADRTEDLLMVADVMRLSHHPAEAVDPLRRIIREHPDDPRASLAAFTLGRVLLDELGQPREAAGAFFDARRLAPNGPLFEDALAREVEARSRAGDARGAQSLARDYMKQFPDGRKLRSVRNFGGLE